MHRPQIEPHLSRLLTSEKTMLGCCVETKGVFFVALYAPVLGGRLAEYLFDSAYGYGEGPTPEDAIYAARDKLWNGL